MNKKIVITIPNPIYFLTTFLKKKKECTHESWYMDNQIRTIECICCGKRAFVKEYKDLYGRTRKF